MTNSTSQQSTHNELGRKNFPLATKSANSMISSVKPRKIIHSPFTPKNPLRSLAERGDRRSMSPGFVTSQNEDQQCRNSTRSPALKVRTCTPEEESETMSISSVHSWRKSVPWATNGITSVLPYLDFLGKDVLQLALNDSVVLQQMIEYCEEIGCEENVEFLMKIKEYYQATNNIALILTNITSFLATQPLNLPPMLSRSMGMDIKRLAHTNLPGLETVFLEARMHIENGMAKRVLPGFMKNQLTRCTAFAAASRMTGSRDISAKYPGLGESFCLTDATSNHSPIVAVSSTFCSLTGYSIEEVVHKSCGFLQGPFTDPDAIRQMQAAIRDRKETVELLLNFRSNDEAFWNLLFLFPLKDAQGTVQYWLGAQVNVSDQISSRKDLLHVMAEGASPLSDPSSSLTPRCESIGPEDSVGKKSFSKRLQNQHERQRSIASRNRILQSLKKITPRNPIRTSSPAPEVEPTFLSAPHPATPPLSKTNGPKASRSSDQRYQPKSHVHVFPTAYSFHMVLRCEHGNNDSSSRKKTSFSATTKLTVVFCSDEAASLLSLSGSEIVNEDVFHILAEKVNSPSVTKNFRATIQERLEARKSTVADLILGRNRLNNSGISIQGSGLSLGRRDNSFELEGMREGAISSASSISGAGGTGKPMSNVVMQEKVMSTWTPLMGGGENVGWVILVFTQPP